MNTKVVGLYGDTITKVGTVIEFTEEKQNTEKIENIYTNTLRNIDKRKLEINGLCFNSINAKLCFAKEVC